MVKVTIKQAQQAGTADGIEAAETLLAEQGIKDLRQCQQPGGLDWDEPAINAGAAEFSLGRGLTDRVKQAYYAAYNDAANRRANALLAEHSED